MGELPFEASEEEETAKGSDESKNDEDAAANGGGNSGTVRAAAGYMLALQVDLVTPEPTDAAWPKWVGHAVLGTTSAIILYSAGKSFLNPNLEETTTSRGNPSDWSFDPEIQRLENDKFINFQGGPPPKWVWPYILGAAGYELYNNWPKPRELPTQKTNDDYFIGPKPFHPNRW